MKGEVRRLIELRWTLVEEATASLNVPLLSALVIWLVLIFASFGYNAPRNLLIHDYLRPLRSFDQQRFISSGSNGQALRGADQSLLSTVAECTDPYSRVAPVPGRLLEGDDFRGGGTHGANRRVKKRTKRALPAAAALLFRMNAAWPQTPPIRSHSCEWIQPPALLHRDY